jgi:hypothetical protein
MRPVSLSHEPFAAAMRELPWMAAGKRELIRERLLKLATAHRLAAPYAPGPDEVLWYAPGDKSSRQLARGHYGGGEDPDRVVLFDALGKRLFEWEGDVAFELTFAGRYAGRWGDIETGELIPLDELYLRLDDIAKERESDVQPT